MSMQCCNTLDTSHAGFWKRFAAYWADCLILIGLYFIVSFIAPGYAKPIGLNDLNPMGLMPDTGFFGLLAFILFWLYSVRMESSKYQGTLGKLVLGIKVTDLQGRPLSLKQAAKRVSYKWGLMVIPFGIFGWLMWTERAQAVQDILAGCLVENK